ncbi:hypothetical protein [Lentilactobacillus kisonensis]|nr:hypothetical protein [Lentilactobacillus kisonensis]
MKANKYITHYFKTNSTEYRQAVINQQTFRIGKRVFHLSTLCWMLLIVSLSLLAISETSDLGFTLFGIAILGFIDVVNASLIARGLGIISSIILSTLLTLIFGGLLLFLAAILFHF